METFQLILLSFVQGLTEFLPVSSSAHLVLLSELINQKDQGIVFDVGVHLGTLIAAVIYFRKDLKKILLNLSSKDLVQTENSLFWNLIVALVPILVFGYFLRDLIEVNLRSIKVIGFTTLSFGALLYIADKLGTKKHNLDSINLLQAFVIGLFQCLSLIPGTSRSGITITAGLFLGLKAVSATRFSFLLAIPTIAVIALVELIRLSFFDISFDGALQLLLASCISFIIAYVSIDVFLKLIDRIGFTPFVIYRLLLGAWILIFIV